MMPDYLKTQIFLLAMMIIMAAIMFTGVYFLVKHIIKRMISKERDKLK